MPIPAAQLGPPYHAMRDHQWPRLLLEYLHRARDSPTLRLALDCTELPSIRPGAAR